MAYISRTEMRLPWDMSLSSLRAFLWSLNYEAGSTWAHQGVHVNSLVCNTNLCCWHISWWCLTVFSRLKWVHLGHMVILYSCLEQVYTAPSFFTVLTRWHTITCIVQAFGTKPLMIWANSFTFLKLSRWRLWERVAEKWGILNRAVQGQGMSTNFSPVLSGL